MVAFFLYKNHFFWSGFLYAAGPVGPCGIVKFRIKFGEVPVMVALASVPGSPVVTVPIVIVGVSASVPVGPVAPVGPVGPIGPVGPVSPIRPWGPVGPVSPIKPWGPVGPVGPVHPTKSVNKLLK